MPTLPTLEDVRAAYSRIRGSVHRTPVLTCASLDLLCGARLFLKAENLQRAGSFKIRGALNAVLLLDEGSASRGVATHSSGNHAQGLSLAAAIRGVPAHIVMPKDAPAVKRAAVEGYGGRVTECEPTPEARARALRETVARTGATFVPPYDDPRVIAGQGTAVLELFEDSGGLDAVIGPVGGGGLLSGTAVACRGLAPGLRVFGAEPELAGDAAASLRTGTLQPAMPPKTVADGLRMPLSELTFSILRREAEGIILVSDEEIVRAMRLLWERAKLVVEPSGAVPLAAVLKESRRFAGLKVGLILSGGNADLDKIPWARDII